MRSLALVLLISACRADGTPPDTGVTSSPHKHMAKVEVTVFTNSASAPLLANTPVAFVDPDGESRVVMTEADGVARGEVMVGGSITALGSLIPESNPPALYTVLDVQDGDRLQVGAVPIPGLEPPPADAAGCSGTTEMTLTYANVDRAVVKEIIVTRMTDADPPTSASTTAITPTTQISIAGPAATRAWIYTQLTSPPPPNAMASSQLFREVIDGCATSYKLDVAKNLLPWLIATTFDPTERALRVAMQGHGGGDLMRIRASFVHSDGRQFNWDVTGPHAGDIYLPELPSPLAEIALRDGDVLGQANTQLLDADEIHGYDHARTLAPTLDWGGFLLERVRIASRNN